MPRTALATASRPQPLRPVERALLLLTLGLDPRTEYTDFEIQSAWRRKSSTLPADDNGGGVFAAAVNAAYLTLVGHGDIFRNVNLGVGRHTRATRARQHPQAVNL